MDIPNNYPFGQSAEELNNIINILTTKLNNKILNMEQKQSIINDIQIGQTQKLNITLADITINIEKQQKIMKSILENNHTTSKLSKYLSFIMIFLAFITLLVSGYSNSTTKTMSSDEKKYFADIISEIDTSNHQLIQNHILLDSIKNKLMDKNEFTKLIYTIENVLKKKNHIGQKHKAKNDRIEQNEQ